MLKALWHLILRFFGIEKNAPEDEQLAENNKYTKRYGDIQGLNFTAIFAARLTTLSVTESAVEVIGENKRAEFLSECADALWDKINRISSGMLGTGGMAVVPYVQQGKLYYNLVPQDRVIISTKKGDTITNATVLADEHKENHKTYYRWVNYAVEGDTMHITSYVTDDGGAAASLAEWDNIPSMAIKGVDRVLFSFFKSPVDPRKAENIYGVPVTYGCDKIIEDIKLILEQIKDEFKYKEVKIFADERMFRKDEKTGKYIMPSKVFFAGHGNEKTNMIEIFSPEIRESSYYAHLVNAFELLEKAVGTSKGILTVPETRGATATEIKASLFETYAMTGEIRKAIEKGVRDYLYCCDVLSNAYNLAPQGEYDLSFDWSYNLIESSAETWQQLIDAQGIGAVSKAEIRQYVIAGETMEEAEKRIEEISKAEPGLNGLLGGGNNADGEGINRAG